MKKENAFLLELQKLGGSEKARFKAFVDSPYFNKHEGVRKLVAWVLEQSGRSDGLTEGVADHLFPGDAQRHKKVAPLLSQGMRLYEEWLGQEVLSAGKDKVPIWLAALEHLRIRGQWKLHEKLANRIEKVIQRREVSDPDQLEWFFKLAWEREQRYVSQSPFHEDPWLQEKVDRLDAYFACEALSCACEIETRRSVLNIHTRQSIFLRWLEQEDLPDWLEAVPLVRAWYLVFQTLRQDNEKSFREAMTFLAEQGDAFEKRMLASLFNYLGNFCARQINKGKSSYLEAMFELYRIQLDKGLLTLEGYISEWQYKNIVATGLLLGHNDWVYHFIHDYRAHLPEEARTNAFTYNLAYYYYATTQFDKVLELLLQVEYRDLRYYVGAKSLLLKTYYELDEGDALRALVSSTRQYLKRKEILTYGRRKAFLRFLGLTLQCYNLLQDWKILHPAEVDKRLFKLRNAIAGNQEIINPDWLWQKWHELVRCTGREHLFFEEGAPAESTDREGS